MAEKKVIELEVKTNAQSLKAQLREAQQEVQALSDKFGATSAQAINAAKRAAELKDAIADAKDLTDATPPANGEEMFPYSDCTRVVLDPTKTFKMSFKPYIKSEASTTATDTGTSYTPGISQPATYLNTSVLPIKHFGFKGWVFCPTTMASQTYSINMKVRRICRWKSLK